MYRRSASGKPQLDSQTLMIWSTCSRCIAARCLGYTGLIALTLGWSGVVVTPLRPVAALAVDQTLVKVAKTNYTSYMLTAYAAAENGDYNTALINFRRALAARPGDRYATAGIRNMETYLARERAEAAKQAEIAQRQATLKQAVSQTDWACAAASVDRLIQLVPPDSPERSSLIAYRGELSGFIQARANLDQWSTVCPGSNL